MARREIAAADGLRSGRLTAQSALALGFGLLLVACGSSGMSSTATTASRAGPAGTAATTTTTRPAPTAPTVVVMTSINPCTLFTAVDASRLAGRALTRASGGDLGTGTCAYSGGRVLIGAELTVKVDGSPEAAHAEFAKWVQPVPNTAPGFSVTPVANLGDEAQATHSGFTDGISFRDGAVLVKIGVYPPVSDAALKTAANAARARL